MDLTDVLAQMASEGYAINKELVACLSPYIVSGHFKASFIH